MILDQLSGLTIELVSSTIYEHLYFSGSIVSATLGEKGGALCAPTLSLHSNAANELVFTSDAGLWFSWADIVIYEAELVVLRNGELARYKILSRAVARKQYLP